MKTVPLGMQICVGCLAFVVLAVAPLRADELPSVPTEPSKSLAILLKTFGVQGYDICPIVIDHNKVMVDVTINNEKLRFVLDSGSPISSVSLEAATKLNLKLTDLHSQSGPLGGTYKVAKTDVKSIKIGTNEIATKGMKVADLSNLKKLKDSDGLIGQDILSRLSAFVDLENRLMFLLPEDKRADSSNAPGKNGISGTHRELGIHDRLSKVRFTKIPLVIDTDGYFKIDAIVNGNKCLMILDTGCGNTSLDSAFAKELGLSLKDGPDDYSLGGTIHTKEAHLQSFRCGALEAPATVTVVEMATLNQYISQAHGKPIAGIVGMNFLEVFGSKIDYRDCNLFALSQEAKHIDQIQGKWQCVIHAIATKQQSSSEKMKMVIVDNKLSLHDGDKIQRYQIEITIDGEYPRMKLKSTEKDKNETIYGLFAFDKQNRFVLLLNDSKIKYYPAGFEKMGPQTTLLVYEKIK